MADGTHATWSASATERNVNCPGALALTDGLPETTSEAADWGTCCHELAELCLRDGGDADERIGMTLKGKKHANEVDEEMAETAQMYVDYVRGRMAAYKAETGEDALLWIEQRFSLESLKPPFDAGGTGDAVIFFPRWKLIEVVDLKGGRGVVVAVTGNAQMRTYALGAMLANPKLKFNTITVTIVQPRAPHKDGRIRSETFHAADLIDWTADLLEAMRHSAEASAMRVERIKAETTKPEKYDWKKVEKEWNRLYLKAGDHCKFCRAAATCPALASKSLDAAKVTFSNLDEPQITARAETFSPAELAARLDLLDMIQDWSNEVRAYAHRLAEAGTAIPGYVLVEKQAREKFNSDEAAALAVQTAKGLGVADDKILNPPKPRTPKQIRDAVAKLKSPAAKAALENLKSLSSAASTGSNLVRSDKTTRTAIAPAANRHFDVLD
jgi:hypothetical protein